MDPMPGDIILYPVTPRSALTSRLIAAGELLIGAGRGMESYSHAAILAEDMRHQFEAKWPKTGRFRIDSSRIYEVWNVGNPSDSQRIRILDYCLDHEGEWYNMIGLLTGGLLGLPRTAVCSQFAGYAYSAAQLKINPEGQRLLSPNAISDYPEARMVRRFFPPNHRHEP